MTRKRQGSPPHTWRILKVQPPLSRAIRITSTYVENTLEDGEVIATAEDHLHIRGEYSLLAMISYRRAGSPPHTWRIR